MPIDNAPRPMIRPPPQMFPGRPMMINPNMRPGPFPGFAIRPDGYRDNSINIDPPKSPEIRRSFDKDNTPPGMHRSESLDDRSLQRKRFNSIAPPSESDMDDTDNDSRRSSSVVNLEVAPIPSFSTIRRRPAQQQHMLSVEQMIDQHREASKNSTDPKVQFEFAKACLAAGEPYVEEGFALLKKIASAGFPEANYFLGEAFADDGKHSMAYSQYLMAAKRGYAPACHAIACCAEAGQGCKKSTRLALEMYTKAATAGNLDSMYRLGLADLNGELGLRPDIQKAVKWFKRAAAGFCI
jgi:hypothetical protein